MEQAELERRVIAAEAMCEALLIAVQTLINLQPNQPLARAAVAAGLEELIEDTLATPETERFLRVLQGMQTLLLQTPSRG